MKKLIGVALLTLCPLIVFAQDAKKEPKKETINTYRVLVKDGHAAAFKAALASHAQKYHTGGWKWRVSEVVSGPDEGTYMILEGPNSWTELDGRGDLGAEHMKDYETNILPHVEKTMPALYATYQPDLSTVAPGAFSNKTLIRHLYIKPAHGPLAMDSLKIWKKVWEKRGQNVGVWTSFFSGENQIILSFRLKDGWKDLDADGISFRDAFKELYGPDAYLNTYAEMAKHFDKIVDEMTEYRPELSSK